MVWSLMSTLTQQPRRIKTQQADSEPTVVLQHTPRLPVGDTPVFGDQSHALPEIPGYSIQKLIDHGGMSNIYLAWQKQLNRKVAIKMIRPQDSLDENIRKRFLLEAESIAALQHPNVVRIHEIGEIHGLPFLVLEYIAGGNLERRIRERPPSARDSAEIVRQLAMGIQAAHDQLIIHRDLKPANVLCVEETASEGCTPTIEVKITDFGLARMLHEQSDQTRSGYAIGTPSFMSPEQASGRPDQIGKGTDIYGLGAILYELLTREPPFNGPSAIDTIQMVRFEMPIRPCLLNSRVPRDLERICLQCLEKKPEDRYPSARAMAEDLQRFLNGQTVQAYRAGPMRTMLRRAVRHPVKAFGLAMVFLMLLLGAVFAAAIRFPSSVPTERGVQSQGTRSYRQEPKSVARNPHRDAILRAREMPASAETVAALANLPAAELDSLTLEFAHEPGVHYALAELNAGRGETPSALAGFERARILAEKAARDSGGGFDAWASVALIREREGDLQTVAGQRNAAIADYDKAMAIREMLIQDDPREPKWKKGLADVCTKLAEAYTAEGELFTAVLLLDRRVGLQETMSDEWKDTHTRLADLHKRLGNTQAATLHRAHAGTAKSE